MTLTKTLALSLLTALPASAAPVFFGWDFSNNARVVRVDAGGDVDAISLGNDRAITNVAFADGRVYAAAGGVGVHRLTPQLDLVATLPIPGEGVAYAPSVGRVFACLGGGDLVSANADDGSDPVVISAADANCHGLGVDDVNGRVYAARFGGVSINFDGSDRRAGINGSFNIAVDPAADRVFVGDADRVVAFTLNHTFVGLLPLGGGGVQSMAIDPAAQRYYVGLNAGGAVSFAYDGSDRRDDPAFAGLSLRGLAVAQAPIVVNATPSRLGLPAP